MAALYAVVSWLILQVADVLFEIFELPSTWAKREQRISVQRENIEKMAARAQLR